MIDILNKFEGNVQIILPPVKKITYPPIKDAMLMQSQPFVNYGESSSMQICPSSDGQYAAVFGFSPLSISSDVWSNIVAIKFKFQVDGYNPDANTVNLYELNGNSWTETGVSWANAPAVGALIASKDIEANEHTIEYDITDYVMQFGNDPTKKFSFYLKGETQIDDFPLMIASRENRTTRSRPVIEISYYNYPGSPFLSTLKGNIDILAYTKKEINGDIDVDSNQLNNYIIGDITVPRFPADIQDINGDITVIKTTVSEINGTLDINKEPTIPAEINGDIEVMLLSGAEISGDLSIDMEVLTPVELDGNIDVMIKNEPSDILGDLTINVESLLPVEINGDIDTVAVAILDINGDLNIDKEPANPVEIGGDVEVSAAIITDINGTITIEIPIGEIDINGTIEVVPSTFEQIIGDITVMQSVAAEISGDVIAMQKVTSFIDGDLTILGDVFSEITGDIDVAVEMHVDINGTITVQAKGSSYVYIL
jgi:hypothetical protein